MFDFTSLFRNIGGSSFINYGEYNSIRSGSYRRLLKSYYSPQKGTDSTKTDKNSGKKTTVNDVPDTDKTGMTKMKAEADSLKKAADSLSSGELWKMTDGSYNMDKIAKAVNNYVNEYNDVITQSGKVSSSDVATNVGYMESMTKTMSKTLAKVGITVGSDNKLSFDEEVFRQADAKTIKSLFSGSASYAGQIAKDAQGVASAALRNSVIYSSNGSASGYIASMFNKNV